MSEARAKIIEQDKSDDLALPSGWVETTLDEIGVWSGGGTPSKRDDAFWTGGTIPWVSPKDMKSFAISDSQDRITHQAVEQSAAKLIPAGAVLFVTRSGILQHTFPVGVTTIEVTVNQDLKAIIPSGGIDSKYLAYFLISNNNKILQDCSKDGTTVQSIDTDSLKSFSFPLAPLAEQKRIVSKIDELFSDIEAGERALKRARAALARYRKSVLKAAVTGELTTDWRAANKERLEPADKLLTRILAARRQSWEKAERAKLKAQGRAPKGEEWRNRYKEPMEFAEVSNAELPTTWEWCSLDAVSWSSSYGTSTKCSYDANGVSVLRIPNVRIGKINFDDLKFAASDSEFEEEDLVSAGDLLIVRTNGSEDIIGIGAVVDKHPAIPTYFASYLIRFRLLTNEPALADWVNVAWQSEIIRDQIRRHAATSAGQYNVSQSNMARFAVPLPPAEEQTEIVSRVEEAFSKADHVEAALNEQERAAHALKQSILKAAFEGRLVPQDGADEPAAKLLERIKMGRK